MIGLMLTGLVGGFLGSAHCIGMCGGFALALGSTDLHLRSVALRQLAYNLGRTCTYTFLGALGAALGVQLSPYGTHMLAMQQVFSFVAGVAMVLIGLSVLGVWRIHWTAPSSLTGIISPLFRACLNTRRVSGFFGAGMLNGYLPCGLVYAFLILTLATPSLVHGMVLMLGFGLGTIPALFAVGCGAKLLNHTARLKVFRVAACFVVVLGITTIVRAIPAHTQDCCQEHVVELAHGQ